MSTRITVSLPEKEHAALAALAYEHDVLLSWLTRKAIIEFLNQHRTGSPLQPALGLPSQRKAEDK